MKNSSFLDARRVEFHHNLPRVLFEDDEEDHFTRDTRSSQRRPAGTKAVADSGPSVGNATKGTRVTLHPREAAAAINRHVQTDVSPR